MNLSRQTEPFLLAFKAALEADLASESAVMRKQAKARIAEVERELRKRDALGISVIQGRPTPMMVKTDLIVDVLTAHNVARARLERISRGTFWMVLSDANGEEVTLCVKADLLGRIDVAVTKGLP